MGQPQIFSRGPINKPSIIAFLSEKTVVFRPLPEAPGCYLCWPLVPFPAIQETTGDFLTQPHELKSIASLPVLTITT